MFLLKPNLCDFDTVIKYITRYLGKPLITLSRIEAYNGESVTFHYNHYKNNAYIERTLPAIEFIKMLMQHSPEKNFKMPRYYGLHARRRQKDQSHRKEVHPSKHSLLKSFTKWRNNILLSFDYDTLCCQK